MSITPGYSDEFSWISIWPLVKPHADCSVAYSKHFNCVLHTIGWIVSIVTCELGERFETHLIKASKFFCFAFQSFKILLICVSIQSFRNQIATEYTICASLYCSYAKQIKKNWWVKITLPNGNHITIPKETKSKQTARKGQSSVWVWRLMP